MASVVGTENLNSQQMEVLQAIHRKFLAARNAGDKETAKSLLRQAEMFTENPEKWLLPRDRGEEFSRGVARGREGQLSGKAEVLGVEDEFEFARPFMDNLKISPDSTEYMTPEDASWQEIAGEIVGSMVIPDPTKTHLGGSLFAGIEGFTAPAENLDQRMQNSASAIAGSQLFKLLGAGGRALFDTDQSSRGIKEATRAAEKHGLPKPLVDDYSQNVLARAGGWLADNPFLVGTSARASRNRELRDFATDEAEKRSPKISGELLSESAKRQASIDWDEAERLYDDAWDYIGGNILNEGPYRANMQAIQQTMEQVGHTATKTGPAYKTIKAAADPAIDGPADISVWHQRRSNLRKMYEEMEGKPGRREIGAALENIDRMINQALPDMKSRMLVQKADSFYGRTIPKYREIHALRKAVNDGDENAIKKMLTTGNLSAERSSPQIQQVWDGLDNHGQSQVAGLIMRQAVENATSGGKFDPVKYAQQLKNLGPRRDIIFDEKGSDLLKGMESVYGLSPVKEGSDWIRALALTTIVAPGAITAGFEMGGIEGAGTSAAILASLAGLSRSRSGNALLRQMGRASDGAEQMRLGHKMALALARNPEGYRTALEEAGLQPYADSMIEKVNEMAEMTGKEFEEYAKTYARMQYGVP
jgi:hypothetical protein